MVKNQTSIQPPTRIFHLSYVHPSQCRSFAYSQDMRVMAVTNGLNGDNGPENQHINNLQNLGQYPSIRIVDRWVQRHIAFGHSRPFC